MTTTFETAKVGDKVWSIERGWGEILSLTEGVIYPLAVGFPNENPLSFTLGGKRLLTQKYQTLFWDEVKIDAPAKPLPDLEVDTKVLVWSDPEQKYRRHFSHFSNGRIYTFGRGRTSFTALDSAPVIEWPNWELTE